MAKKKSRRTTVVSWIERPGPLAPWMQLYAQWMVAQPQAELSRPKGEKGMRSRRPTSLERQVAASKFAARSIDRMKVTLLERRPEFVEYFDKLRTDAQFEAQELMRGDIAENIASRREGLRKASGWKVDEKGEVSFDVADHKAIEHYTRPIVDLAFPKKVEKPQTPQRFTIILNGMSEDAKRHLLMSAAGLEEENDVSYEIIPNDKLLTDGDE